MKFNQGISLDKITDSAQTRGLNFSSAHGLMFTNVRVNVSQDLGHDYMDTFSFENATVYRCHFIPCSHGDNKNDQENANM